ncbi:DUF6274 family protein [Streptomyces sp. NPDC006261]|uniref:DUF6274 family protein n=1 Tax=Streptomyces sp. NPDC006261 TaxID=3156739 RepID=UPI0033B51FAD
MSAPTARHETRALLRAHLAAAYGYGHVTRHCPVCHRLLRLAMEPGDGGRDGGREAREPGAAPGPPDEPQKSGNRAGSPADPDSTAVPLEGDEDERPVAP